VKNPLVDFLLTTLIGGAVFLVPVGVVLYIGYQAVLIMMLVAEPLAGWINVDSVAGIAVANLIALAAVIAICFVAGLLARHTIAGPMVKKLDSLLISVPGYSMIRGIKSGFEGEEQSTMRPVLLTLGSAQRIGLEVQQLDDGRSMIYLPSSPSTWSGITQVLPADQITYIDVPVTKVMELTEKFGHGVDEVLAKTETSPEEREA
jgi:uncharacterized membrane protein